MARKGAGSLARSVGWAVPRALHRHLPRAKILEISLDLLHSAAGAENSEGARTGRAVHRAAGACRPGRLLHARARAWRLAACLCAAAHRFGSSAPSAAHLLLACYALLAELLTSGIRVPLFPVGSLHKSLDGK